MKSKGGTTSLKCRRLFYWRAPEMVGSVFLCPQQICPPAANVPAVTNLLSLYHPQSTYICNRRPPSSHLFFSFVVRVQKCQICHIIWTRWWQILVEMRFMKSIQFRWKASWSMLWLIFFLFKSTNIQLNLASAVVSSQGGEFLMAAEPQQLQMWNPTTNFAPQLS